MTDISAILALFGALLSLALPASLAVGWLRGMGARPLRSVAKFLPCGAFGWTLFLSALCGLVQSAATKETNGVARAGSAELKMESGELRTENDGVAAVGDSTDLHSPLYVLHSVTTNGSHSYAMPSNAVLAEKWWRRGAYEDIHRVDLGAMRFPLGTNLCNHIWAYTWGEAWPRLSEASSRVVATGVPMSAVPGVSRFWSAVTDESATLTWQCFFLGRDTNTPVSAQLELFPSGDYTARSNEVAHAYRRVNPDDFDGDGLPNDLDGDPHHCDGDHFGPHQTLPEGANPDAYCWVDVVVSNADSLVTFTGDGPSALPDPRFVARAGETYRVTLLIGKAYQVTCPMPVAVVGASDPEIEVHRTSANRVGVLWPVETWSEDRGSYFEMYVSPGFLGGAFDWSEGGCCAIAGGGAFYSFLCGGSCGCDGCMAEGLYVYEGYSLAVFGGECGCEPHEGEEDNEPSGVGVGFSQKVLFYEDAYYDEALGVMVPAHGEETVALKCSVSGGPYGGVFRLALENIDKLERIGGDVPPVGYVDVAANEKRTWRAVYKFAEHSDSEDDVRATATFTENLSGVAMSDEDCMTVVMLQAEADAFWPTNMFRRTFGVGETARIYKFPDIETTAIASRGACIANETYVDYSCPHRGDEDDVVITAKQCLHTMRFSILEPTEYVVANVDTNIFAQEGESGGFDIDFTCRILPGHVSFGNLQVIELPRVSTDAIGYYAQPSKAHILDHGLHGAGTWTAVRGQNNIRDETRMDTNPQPWLGGGSFTWPIPTAWRVENDIGVTNIFGSSNQRFELDADGTARLMKFHHVGERMTNGVFRQWRTN